MTNINILLNDKNTGMRILLQTLIDVAKKYIKGQKKREQFFLEFQNLVVKRTKEVIDMYDKGK
jgi:hypothetical protein